MSTVNGTAGSDFVHVSGDGLTPPPGYTDISEATDAQNLISSGGGGDDIIHAGAGNDIITFGGDLDSADLIDGGAGFDTLVITAEDFVNFAANSLASIEQISIPSISLDPLTLYGIGLTMNDANVTAGASLAVDASALTDNVRLTFDGSAETNGHFAVTGGAGNDVITGGSQSDSFDLSDGGIDRVNGGGGSDTFKFGDSLTTDDTVIGDPNAPGEVSIRGTSYAAGLTFSATTIQNIGRIDIYDAPGAGHYVLTTNDANVAAGKMLEVAANLSFSGLIFDGSAETDGKFNIIGGVSDDIITGGARADRIELQNGGNDIVNGGAGNDLILGVTEGDKIDGGAGTDKVVASVLQDATNCQFAFDSLLNVENLNLVATGLQQNILGHFIMDDGNVAAGKTLTVTGIVASFDGSAETDGHFRITQTASNTIDGPANWTGGALSDSIDVSQGSSVETVNGGGGNDMIKLGAKFDGVDVIDGGAGGKDTVILDGDYAAGLAISGSMLSRVEILRLVAGHDYKLSAADAVVAAGHTLSVAAGSFGAGDRLIFDGSAETDGHFALTGGAGNDLLTGGAGNDVIRGGGGVNHMTGGGGADALWAGNSADIFVFAAAAESTGSHYDTIHNIDFTADHLDTPGPGGTITAIDPALLNGSLSTAGFNADLHTALQGHLGAHHAVLFTPNGGTLRGETFLVVDLNGIAGYQANADLVIHLTGQSGALSVADFI